MDPDLTGLMDAAAGPRITLHEYIAELQVMRDKHGGNILVQKWSAAKGRHNAPLPKVAYTICKKAGHAVIHVPAFWSEHDHPDQKGFPVIRL